MIAVLAYGFQAITLFNALVLTNQKLLAIADRWGHTHE
jgi:hypothetical protein